MIEPRSRAPATVLETLSNPSYSRIRSFGCRHPPASSGCNPCGLANCVPTAPSGASFRSAQIELHLRSFAVCTPMNSP